MPIRRAFPTRERRRFDPARGQLWVGLPHGERGAGLLALADDPELIVLTGEPVGG